MCFGTGESRSVGIEEDRSGDEVNKKNNLLFTICARVGSKGVKGKNTKVFCGMPYQE